MIVYSDGIWRKLAKFWLFFFLNQWASVSSILLLKSTMPAAIDNKFITPWSRAKSTWEQNSPGSVSGMCVLEMMDFWILNLKTHYGMVRAIWPKKPKENGSWNTSGSFGIYHHVLFQVTLEMLIDLLEWGSDLVFQARLTVCHFSFGWCFLFLF